MAFNLGSAIVKITGNTDGLDSALNQGRGRVRTFLSNMGRGVAQGVGQAVTFGATQVISGLGDALASAGELQQVSAAFNAITADMQGGAEGMLKALQDGSGQMVTNTELMTAYNKANSLVGEDFANRLPEAMQLLQKQAAATGEDMSFFTDSLVTGIGRMSPMILDNLGLQVSLAEANQKYAESIGKNVDELTKQEQQTALMNEVMGQLAEKTAELPDVANSATAVWTQFQTQVANTKDELILKFLPALTDLFNEAVPLIEGMIPPLMSMADGFLAFAQEHGPAFREIMGQVMSVVGQLIEYVSANGPQIVTWIASVGAGLATFTILTTVAGWISSVIAAWGALSAAFTAGSGVIAVVVGILGGPVTVAIGLVAGAIALLTAAWRNNWFDIQGRTETAVAAIQAVIQAFLALVQTWWAQNGDAVIAIVTGFVQGIEALWQGLVDNVTTLVTGFMAAMEGDWGTFKDSIVTVATNLVNGIRDVVATLWSLVQPVLSEAVQNMMSALRDVDWAGVGSAIIQGVKNGVSNGVGALKDAVRNAAQAALDAAKNLLGINSPSLVFQKQVGEPIPQGMAAGIDAQVGLVERATQRLSDAALRASTAGNTTTNNNIGGNTFILNGVRNGSNLADFVSRSRRAQVAGVLKY